MEVWQTSNLRRLILGEEKKKEEEQKAGHRTTITKIFCPALDSNQYITTHVGSRGVRYWLVGVSITIETLVKYLAFLNSATAKMSWLEMIIQAN